MTTTQVAVKTPNVPPEIAERLIRGEISIGEMVGLTQSAQYAIAGMGHQLLEANRLEEAQAIFRGLVALSPYDSVFHCHLATVYARKQMVDEAIQSYKYALDFNKANIDALAGLGEMKLMRGEVLEATELLKRAVTSDSTGKYASAKRAAALLAMLQQAVEQQQAANKAAPAEKK